MTYKNKKQYSNNNVLQEENITELMIPKKRRI